MIAARRKCRRWRLYSGRHRRGRMWHGAQQFADQAIKFDIGDDVRRLLLLYGPAQHTREAENTFTSTRYAIWRVVFTYEFAFHTEGSGLQTNEVDFGRTEPTC